MSSITVLTPDWFTHNPGGGGEGSGTVGGSASPIAYDSFARRPDGLLTNGMPTASGHVYTVRANYDWARYVIEDGALTHSLGTDTTTSAAYAGIEIPGPVGRIWADFEVTDANTEEVVLVVSGGDRAFVVPQVPLPPSELVGHGFADAAAHLTISPNGWSYGILTNSPWSIDPPASGPVNGAFNPPLEPGVRHTITIDFDGDQATVTTPRGIKITCTDPRFATPQYRGRFACVESYASQGNLNTPARILSWGAVQEAPLAARSFTPDPPPAMRAMQYRPQPPVDVPAPGVSTDIHPDFALPITIPSGGKLLVTVAYWLDQSGTDSTYLMGLNHGSGSGDGVKRAVIGPYRGIITSSWLWEINAPGYVTTIRPEHFMVNGGAATARFDNSMGWYGTITATPVT